MLTVEESKSPPAPPNFQEMLLLLQIFLLDKMSKAFQTLMLLVQVQQARGPLRSTKTGKVTRANNERDRYQG